MEQEVAADELADPEAGRLGRAPASGFGSGAGAASGTTAGGGLAAGAPPRWRKTDLGWGRLPVRLPAGAAAVSLVNIGRRQIYTSSCIQMAVDATAALTKIIQVTPSCIAYDKLTTINTLIYEVRALDPEVWRIQKQKRSISWLHERLTKS
ncbi:hypothetical protein ABZP36_005619 [Zizania latifolia]